MKEKELDGWKYNEDTILNNFVNVTTVMSL